MDDLLFHGQDMVTLLAFPEVSVASIDGLTRKVGVEKLGNGTVLFSRLEET